MIKKIIVPAAVSSQLDDSGKERIHMAPLPDSYARPIWIPSVPPQLVFAGEIAGARLLVSSDGGLTWPTTVDTGGMSAANSLANEGSRIGRHTALAGRFSADGTTFADIAGDLSGTGAPMWSLYTGSEYLRMSVGGLRASADGVTYAARTIPALGVPNSAVNSVAKRGNNIVCSYLVGATNRVLSSVDNGATWAAVSTGSTTQLVATDTSFLAFVGSSGRVDRATTGANGTWSFNMATLPLSTGFVRGAAYSPELDRVVVANGAGQIFFSNNDGSNWTAAATLLPDIIDQVDNTGLIYAHGRFILVYHTIDTSYIYTSEDGDTWTQRHSELSADMALYHLAYLPEAE